MNLGTRKLPGSGEAPREGFSGNPRIIAGAIFDANCKLQIARKCYGVFKKTEPQQTLNSLFSCLGSSVKDT